MSKVKIYRVSPNVQIPKYSTKSSACFDIHAFLDVCSPVAGFNQNNEEFVVMPSGTTLEDLKIVINPGDRLLVPTGLIFDIPQNYSIRCHPRSGNSVKRGLTLCNAEGVIDEDYTEPIFVTLWNISTKPQYILNQERLCQGELVKDTRATFEEIDTRPETKTDRTGGFGSTGK